MKKRILLLFLAIALVAALPLSVSAASLLSGGIGVMAEASGTGFENGVADSGGLTDGYIKIQTVILLHKKPPKVVQFNNKLT